ncbi:MAG: AraC family transcriptional regulator [Verrucomicrobiota bacterium]
MKATPTTNSRRQKWAKASRDNASCDLPRPMLTRAKNIRSCADCCRPMWVIFRKPAGICVNAPMAQNRQSSSFAAKAKAGVNWQKLATSFAQARYWVIPPDTAHTYGADATRPWTIHSVSRARRIARRVSVANLKSRRRAPYFIWGRARNFWDCSRKCWISVEHGYTTPQLIGAAQALAHLLAVLIREQRQPNQHQPGPAQRITQSIAYMKQHLNQPLQLDALAAIANLSRSRYVELFKQQSGYAPIDYFIRLKMHRACQLLDTTDASVKEVATQLGYEDPLYFSRVFRVVNDRTPTEYRKLRKG